MYNFVMRRRKSRSDAIGLILVLLIFPLVVYWREILVIGITILFAKIIYKIIKSVSAINDKDKAPFVGDIVNLKNDYQSKEYEVYAKDKYVIKGTEAENNIIRILERIYNKENIIHDSYFRDDELVTTQVDIVTVDTSGIYVIESKAYSSIIKGKTNEKDWVQLFRGKKYQRFSNPVIQNNRHIKAIKNNLISFGIPDEAFKSYIVFADDCKLCIEIDDRCDTKVIKQKELFYTMLEDMKTTQNILNEKQVQEISIRINAHANIDEKIKMDHVIRRQNNVKYVKKGR